MGRKNTLDKAFIKIERFFDGIDVKSFTEYKFAQIFHDNRREWGVSTYTSPSKLSDYLLKKQHLNKTVITDSSNNRKIIYSWKTKDELTIIRGIKQNSYYAYYTSIFLHGLTLQIPKTIYLNLERSMPLEQKGQIEEMTQNTIDIALGKPQRKTSNQFVFKNKKIIITNGKYTERLGVIRRKNDEVNYLFTDLERTLIDIAVRPVYSGGVFEVKEAYKKAKNKLNVQLLKNYLDKLEYSYPYHQVIGFYLDKCGYDKEKVEIFNIEKKYDFYLTYNIRDKEYSTKWRMHYPKHF